jgi:hypothetical protein
MNTNTILISSALCANDEAHGASTHRKFSGFNGGEKRSLIVDICAACARDLRNELNAEIKRQDESDDTPGSFWKEGNRYVSKTNESDPGFYIEIWTQKMLVSNLVKAIGRATEGEKRLRWYLIADRSSTQAQIDRAERLANEAQRFLAAAEAMAQGLSTER